jgi:hypothetical protein
VATADGRIATVAGAGAHGYSGDGGSAVLAELALTPGYVGQGVATAVVVDVDGTLYIADQESQRVRRVAKNGTSARSPGPGPRDSAATAGLPPPPT